MFLFACLCVQLVLFASAVPFPQADPASTLRTYDYVVVGCGISGLVVASRLSENPDISVLCIEAGPFDTYEPIITYPINIGAGLGTVYDWNLTTVPQQQLNGNPITIPMGRGVGGGSLINGMVWNRGNQEDYNEWASFGNKGWTWDELLPYFKKSETYTPVYYSNQTEQLATFNPDVHGFQGPVHVSYPEQFWPQSTNWISALKSLGVPEVYDPNEGLSAGGFYLPVNIHPLNQTRSDARRSYYDPVESRSNLEILSNTLATKVLFNSGNTTINYNSTASAAQFQARATAVVCATGPSSVRETILARKEIIIAAGAIHSPQILQLSGIGPSKILRDLSIPVVQDLIGVGNNLQDHCMIHLNYSYTRADLMTPYSVSFNESLNDECRQEYLASKTGPWTGRPSTAMAFPSLDQITKNTVEMIDHALRGKRHYPPGYDTSLKAGYELQFRSILTRLLSKNTPAFENLNNNAGGLDISLQHPLSRGTVMITTSDPFISPDINPCYLTNPLDLKIMIHAMQFNQRILDTPAIQSLLPSYPQVPPNASVSQLAHILRTQLATEFHYSGTCAMLPQALGGVVDANLIVYGTQNLRVVDTSIFPLIPAAHLQAPAFAVAEKAADLIKGANATVSTGEHAVGNTVLEKGGLPWQSWIWRLFGLGSAREKEKGSRLTAPKHENVKQNSKR